MPPAAPCIEGLLTETDALVIGAGPVGLFQVFELGLLGVHCHVVDVLPHPGGQCAELYADKPIYDIPALPVCTGQELTQRLLQQIAPLGTTFHYGQEVVSVQKQSDDRFLVGTSHGTRFLTKTVFIAAGVGAFLPRTLPVEGLARFAGTQLSYRVNNPVNYAGKHLVIVGGDEAALDSALQFCAGHADGYPHKAASVTLLHRRDAIAAAPAKLEQMHALCVTQALRFMAGQITGFTEQDDRLQTLQVLGVDARTHELPLDFLLVQLGLSPKLGPLAHWGLEMQRKQLAVDTEKFSTSEPGIFAVGDINTYPGKKKLILCGFHEATLAAFGAMNIIAPGQHIALQYTTSSTALHQILGV